MPQTTLLYETVPLFLIPATIVEGGALWLGSWLTALWVWGHAPYANDAARFAVSAHAIGIAMYLPSVMMTYAGRTKVLFPDGSRDGSSARGSLNGSRVATL